jgi:hypothetical protein
MMTRFKLAARILFGLPLRGVRIDESLLLDEDKESEADYTKTAPFDLVFGGVVGNEPPTEVFQDGRFRVCLFPEKGQQECCQRPGPCRRRWLVLELKGERKWQHLLTMHENNLAVMRGVLGDVAEYLGGSPPPGDSDEAGRLDRQPKSAAENGPHLRVVRGEWAAQVWRFPRTLGQNIFFVDLLNWSEGEQQ